MSECVYSVFKVASVQVAAYRRADFPSNCSIGRGNITEGPGCIGGFGGRE
jgi:hypothetical protein